MNEVEKDDLPSIRNALLDLTGELARMHGALLNLIVRLYKTSLSPTQKALLQAADLELRVSQDRFFAKYDPKASHKKL